MIALIRLALMSWTRRRKPSLGSRLRLAGQGSPLVHLGCFGARIRWKRLLILLLLLNLILGSGLGELEEGMRAVPLCVSAAFILVPALLSVFTRLIGLRDDLGLAILDAFREVGGGLLLEVLVLGLLDGSRCVLASKELRIVHGVSFRGRLPPNAPLVLSGYHQFVLLLGSLVASSAAWHDERRVLAHLRRRRPRLFDHDGVCLRWALQFHTLPLQADRIADLFPFVQRSRRALLIRSGGLLGRLL